MKCLCGCGADVNNKYIVGHNHRKGEPGFNKPGYKLGEQARKNISEGHKKYWSRIGGGPMSGRKHTETQKANNKIMAALYLDRGPSENAKKARAAVGWKRGVEHHLYGVVPKYHKIYVPEHDIYVRSSYEVRFIEYCNSVGEEWMYESKTFDLGGKTYTPDFYLPRRRLLIEVKGRWMGDAREKFEQFIKQYPRSWILPIERKTLKELELGIIRLPSKRSAAGALRIFERGMAIT